MDVGKNPFKAYTRATYNNQAQINEKARDDLLKKAEQVRAGKMTDNQKKLLIVGGLAAVAVAGAYGKRQYDLNQAGINKNRQKELFEENHRNTTDQWNALGLGHHEFQAAGGVHSTGNGSFYAGFTNKKAFSRPEFTIPKDTVFQRLSNHEEDSTEYGKMKGAYATFLHNDKKIYGASGEFGDKKYTISFKPEGDVRVPTVQTVVAHLKQVKSADNPNYTNEQAMSDYRSMAGGGWSDHTSMRLFDSLRTYGYSAIVDDMDAGYLGDLPVVFFGKAQPATSTPRTARHKLEDSVGIVKLSRKHS
jgi:hypothetical protein